MTLPVLTDFKVDSAVIKTALPERFIVHEGDLLLCCVNASVFIAMTHVRV